MTAILRKLALLIAVITVVVVGGELILLVIEEAADLALEATHALFLVLFEQAFRMPHAKAEGLAAWVSAGVLLALTLLAVWKSIPRIKRAIRLWRDQFADQRTQAVERWRTARWYQKALFIFVGLGLLLLGSMFI